MKPAQQDRYLCNQFSPCNKWAPLLLLAHGIVGCGGDAKVSGPGLTGTGGQGTVPENDAGSSIVNPCVPSTSDLASRDANELFGLSTVPTFDLYLPAEDWTNLKVRARDEVYVPAQACFEGQAVGLVGFRFKGSYGSLFNCFDAAGNNTCRKLGMKIKFDEYVSSQHFFGLKRLNFQGYHWDDSYMKEHLSYELYRSMGIVAPRSSWAQLRVNGEEQGLFGMVEQIDGRFTSDRWPDNGDGNLFKEAWPGKTDASSALSHLETNEEVGDVSAMVAFNDGLNAASNDNLRATLAGFTDVDYFARYMAVDDAIANFDGITTYYTSGGTADQAGNHNFYFYQEATNKFTIVPWDLEATLSTSGNFGNVPYWQATPTDCRQTYKVWGGENEVIAPGCDRVFQALAADATTYRAAARQLLDGSFGEAAMSAEVDSIAALIREAAYADTHGPGATGFDNGIGYIKQDVPRLRRRLEHLLSGEVSIPTIIDATIVTDFETADDYGLIDGPGLMSNAHTTASVQVNSTEPISGLKSLRITFSYNNEAEPYQQWMWYRIPMSPSPTDLTKLTGIKLKIRSSVARGLRLDLISPNNSQTMKGIDPGWDLQATTTATEVSVQFAKAKVPSWATDPGDDLNMTLQTVTTLSFHPGVNFPSNTTVAGQLPDGVTDDGWVDVDDITFF
jgi:spore coat protein H